MDTLYTKTVNWENVKANEKVTIEIETDKELIKIDPYFCAVIAMIGYWPLLGIFLGKFQDMPTFFLHKIQTFADSSWRVRNTSDVEFQESPIINAPENQEFFCSTLLLGLRG